MIGKGEDNLSSLDFLYKVKDDELEILADILREKGGITASLPQRSNYLNKKEYTSAIIVELLDYGSNTLWVREGYDTLVNDVCDKMDVDLSSDDSLYEKENKLLGKVSSDLWDEMSEEGRKALLEAMNEQASIGVKGGAAMFAGIFRAGGFKSYQLSVIIANSMAKWALGRGLSFGLNATLTRVLSFLSGPLGGLMTVWTAIQIMGPAYRVTVPAVTYVASLRRFSGGI